MLLKLISNLDFDWNLLIVDAVRQPGYPLLSSIVRYSLEHSKQLVCLDIDGTAKELSFLPSAAVVMSGMEFDLPSSYEKIFNTSEDIIVTIPSLSIFILRYGIQKLASLLRFFKSNSCVKHLVALLHEDVMLDTDQLSTVKYLFSTVITLQPMASDLVSHYNGCVKCMHHKQNGKLETSEEYYSMEKDFSLKLVHASTSTAIKTLVESSTNGSNLISNLTFNLTLSDKERLAKNSLQLPYLKKEEEKTALLSSRSGGPQVSIGAEGSTSGGKIYYQYDEADDFDEEDPDDDLDI